MAVWQVATPVYAQEVQTQTLDLVAGWNAVFLEVDPIDATPDTLFAEFPIDSVATLGTAPVAQFVRNTGVDIFKAYGWAVWYAPDRPDAFLSTLYAVQGGKPYLVHALTNVTFSLTGTVPPLQMSWTPDAYNFVGFSVQAPGAPTFEQFFSGSTAHQQNRLYRLVNGTWKKVLDPGAQTMRSGEAFWIYCQGASDYTGPLSVTVPSPFGLFLSSRGGGELVIRNRTSHPVSFTLEHVTQLNAPVPLSVSVEMLDEIDGGLRALSIPLASGDWQQDFPPLEAGCALRLPFVLRLQDIESGTRYSLIRVVSDMGTITTIPITATRDDFLTR